MKIKKIAYEYKAKTTDYLVALAYYPNFIKLLNVAKKPYSKLIEWLLSKEPFLLNDSLELPSIKELSKELNIESAKLTKYLKEIYFEIIDLNKNHPELFIKDGQIRCYLGFTYFEQSHTFTLGLNYLLRADEHFSFYFIKPILGNSSYYVQQVYHDYEFSGHSTVVTLVSSLPYKYMSLLKEKAYLHGQISLMDFISSEKNSELEEKLLRIFKTL